MSRESTRQRVADLKAEVMGLCEADGLAGDDVGKRNLLSAAVALEMVEKRLSRSRPAGAAFVPPAGLAGREDVREKQLPPRDRR